MPEVGQQEVLVRVLAVGICAGDSKCYAGVPYFWGRSCVGVAVCMWVWQYACGCGSMHVGVAVCMCGCGSMHVCGCMWH